MAYRTYVNGVQIFGNNLYHTAWMDMIRAAGIAVEPGTYRYAGELTDFMAALAACEKSVQHMEESRRKDIADLKAAGMPEDKIRARIRSLFDLTDLYEQADTDAAGNPAILDQLMDAVWTTHLFAPYRLYKACQADLEPDPNRTDRFRAYKLKPGCVIRVEAG